jgi:hypothetical protein
MSADHDALICAAQQLIATRITLLHSVETLHRKMLKCLDGSGARIGRTRQLLAASAALLQQSKSPRPRD